MVGVETEDLVITYLTLLSPDISPVCGFITIDLNNSSVSREQAGLQLYNG